jgi:hypothetical protein
MYNINIQQYLTGEVLTNLETNSGKPVSSELMLANLKAQSSKFRHYHIQEIVNVFLSGSDYYIEIITDRGKMQLYRYRSSQGFVSLENDNVQ